MWERSRLLNEPCQNDVVTIEKAFDKACLSLRMLDPARQLEIFHALVREDATIQTYLRTTIRHLGVDDVDETTPSQQAFVRWLAPQAASSRMTCDPDGGSRRGYLNAFPYNWPKIKASIPGETLVLERKDPVATAASHLLSHWLESPLPESITHKEFSPLTVLKDGGTFATRLELWDAALHWVIDWLEAGESAGQLALVLPKHDAMATDYLVHGLRQRGIACQTLSGTQRPMDDPITRCYLLTLQQLHARRWGHNRLTTPMGTATLGALSGIDIQTLLTQLLQVDVMAPECVLPLVSAITQYEASVSQRLSKTSSSENTTLSLFPLWPALEDIPATETFRWEKLPAPIAQRYKQYRAVLNHWHDKPFSRQIYGVFQEGITPFGLSLTPAQGIKTLIQRAESYSQACERLAHLEGQPANDPVLEWMLGVRQGQLADTPSAPAQAQTDAVLIGTPQKLIDVEARRKRMAWLDVSCREWARSDQAPLYNAWVHSAYWETLLEERPSETTQALETAQDILSDDLNRQLIRRRAGHLTRTLMLLATDSITTFHSQRDDLNREQTGDLEACLRSVVAGEAASLGIQSSQQALASYPKLRDDQAPILEYSGGSMAIAAVPGAGKTFVNVALILKLIAHGINGSPIPTESILVLTYMDSAARTLLGRLQRQLGANSPLPTVSTIHGLAFRILSEQDRFKRFSELGDELALMDEFEQQRLLESIAQRNVPPLFADNPNKWVRLCQRLMGDAKTYRVSPQRWASALQDKASQGAASLFPALDEKHQQTTWALLAAMQPVVEAYQTACQQRGMIDFTDLIGYAIRLLEEDPAIRAQVQQRYQVILEDEAQDSSHLLQRLIELIGGTHDGKTPNLIRTGDTNQSITTSFTAADPSVFREFTQGAAQKVLMNGSARCAPEVMALANEWMTVCQKHPALGHAFEPVTMVPVSTGGLTNPSLLFPIEAHRVATPQTERTFLIERLSELKLAYPQARMAVLLATNDDVLTLTQALQEAGLPAVCLSEQLNTQPVFQVLRHLTHLLANPTQTHHASNLLEALHWANRLPTHGLLEEGPTLAEWQEAIAAQSLWFNDDWPHPALTQWVYDVRECQRLVLGGNVAHMMQIALQRWFSSPTDRSNGWLCALEVQRFLDTQPTSDPLAQVAAHLDRLHAARRFRQPFGDPLDSLDASVIQVMTLHKSKGQEFDIVLLPGLVQHEFRADWDERLSYGFHQLLQTGYSKTPAALVRLKQEERARLQYVGISRARKALIATSPAQGQQFGRLVTKQPARVFELIEATAHPTEAPI